MPSAGTCSAVGRYIDSSGNNRGLLESFSAAIPGAGTPSIPRAGKPSISKLRLFPPTVSLAGRRVRGRCVKATKKNKGHHRCRLAIKLHVRYTLNIAATVTITLEREAPGREVKGGCVKQTRHNRHHQRCVRWVKVPGTNARSAPAGSSSFTFNGKIGGRALGPGTYQLRVIPIAGGLSGAPRHATFKIIG